MNADDFARIAQDPLWFAHRYDPGHDAFHFLQLTREVHRQATFVTDEYLPANLPRLTIRRSDAMARPGHPAPLHFIFHSAFCCSTLLARAVDIEGVAMGLKEPPLFNDLAGWAQRGGTAKQVAGVLDDGLTLLARPFAPGEAVIIKPSNIANAFAPAMLAMRPGAHAVLLYAPLRTYLGSIARKGMWGRLWARNLLVQLLKAGLVDLGFETGDYLGQTDLQVAAVGWLAQQALFAKLVTTYGASRVRTLNSETLTGRPRDSIEALSRLFGLGLDAAGVARVVGGPAFTTHSKSGEGFGSVARAGEVASAATLYGDEIDKVAEWAAAVAASAGVATEPPGGLLG